MATITQEGVPEVGKKSWNWIAPREYMEPLAGVPHEELTTVRAAARAANLEDKAIYRRMRDGSLPFTQIDGIYLVRRADVSQIRRGKPGRPRKKVASDPQRSSAGEGSPLKEAG